MKASIQVKNGFIYVVLSYLKDGKWCYKWISTGVRAKGGKKLVKDQLDDYVRKYQYLETGEPNNDILYSDYLREWLDGHKDQIALSSAEAYEISAKAHIFPYFEKKKYRLEEMSPKVIAEFYRHLHTSGNHKTGGGLSYASIKKIASILKSSLGDAYVLEIIPSNPALGVKIPKGAGEKQVKRAYRTAAEAQKILDAFKGHELYPIVYMTLFYELRRSEIIGLKWENVDLEADAFEIKSTIVRVKTLIESNTTKSEDSNAVFELLPEFKEMLIELKKQSEENRRLLGKAYIENDYVFVRANGDFFRPDYISNNFRATLKKAGLPPMRFHDLRHSAASVLYDLGWDIERIKSWLRHADIKTTSNIYTHISKERRKIDAYELRGLYNRKSDNDDDNNE